MNENTFVAVGRIERIMTCGRGLNLVIGGTGPMKGLVSVQLRDPALIKLVTTQGSGFAAGDVVSVGGKLEYDPETHQNVAIAATDRVSRIARGANASVAPAPAAAGASFFGHCERAGLRAGAALDIPAPSSVLSFSTHMAGDLVGLGDVLL
ncbi:hypothetical protein [Massilia orientalis]|uniref:Uncharacterized protein n=1 Tax=Massilia orientalis TaxID=3050128 RepID=A0ACC7MG34_9BURK|nr:hypothetical protein [Massilia sp. YIM B02787]